MALVPVELTRVMLVETSDQQVVVLQEKGGGRSFPIIIGVFEAVAIHRQLRGEEMPRPMTHDLIVNMINAIGATVEKVVVNDLVDGTFFGQVHLRLGDRVYVIDARPSDSIAIAVRVNCPIFVDEQVFEKLSGG